MPSSTDVLKGTLDLMVLKALSWGPVHGYGIVKWIRRVSDDALQIEDGALYPALHRLEDRGWIQSEWGRSFTGRRAKFYSLTDRGSEQLSRELRSWSRFSDALWKLVNATEHPT